MTGAPGRRAGRTAGARPHGRRPRLVLLAAALLLAGAACAGGSEALPRPAPTTTTTPLPPPAPEPPPPTLDPTTTTTALPAEAVDDPAPTGARPAAAPRSQGAPTPTGRIEIPAIGLDHPTFEGVELSILNYGPGHWPGTAMPGENGNTVFPGHRTTYTRPFWDIDKLAAGDLVIFSTPAGRFTYRVAETLVVPADALWITNQTPGPTMTIFGCHPKGSARYRYVARGPLVGTKGPVELARPSGSSGSSGSGGGSSPTTEAAPPPTTSTTAPPPIGLPCLLCPVGN